MTVKIIRGLFILACIIMGVICLFAFVVTWLTRIDMTGRSLEDLEENPHPLP